MQLKLLYTHPPSFYPFSGVNASPAATNLDPSQWFHSGGGMCGRG